MNILAIESSCDETAAAVIQDGRHILSNVVVSQIDIFAAYGGVIPEIAARSHLEAILPVVHQALTEAHCTWDDIHSIAVTHTPGLLGSLLVGTLTARTLAILHHKPLYPVHHLKSHIYACWLNAEKPPKFPILSLVISGGHTQIIYMPNHNEFQIIGTTRDDAVGECFDKVAKILGLPYPGGPSIAAAATHGDPRKYHFPHPKLTHVAKNHNQSFAGNRTFQRKDHTQEGAKRGECVPPFSLDFSFSGLKTAVLREVQKAANKPISFPSHDLAPLLTPQQIHDFAASFQQTATDILLEKLQLALQQHPDTQSIVFAGGVSANQLLRSEAAKQFPSIEVFFPQPKFSGDNAAMVGAAAFYEIQSGTQPTDPYHLNIFPRSPIQ